MKNLVVKFTLKIYPRVKFYKNSEFEYSTDHIEEAVRYDKVELDSLFDNVYCNERWEKSILEL